MKSRVSQLLIAACLSASMALAAVPAGAAPVFAAEETDTAGTEQGNSTGKSNTGTPAGERESSGGTQDGSQSSGQNNTSEETKDDEKNTAQGGSTEISQGGTQGSTDGSTEENSQQGATGEVKEDTSDGKQDGSQTGSQGSGDDTTQGAITGAGYITPPETVKWIDEKNLILGISPVENADWFEIQYTSSDNSDWYVFDQPGHLTLSTDNLYEIDVNHELQMQESSSGKSIIGKVQLKVYAGVGSHDVQGIDKAAYTPITVSNYKSYLENLTETPKPTAVSLTLDKDNKLVVSFQQEKLEGTYPEEYQLQFYLNGKDITYTFSYSGYTHPSNLIWTEGTSGIEIPVTDYLRAERIDKALGDSGESKLTVTVRARNDTRDDAGNYKYRVSQASDPIKAIDYRKATPTNVTINNETFNAGNKQEITIETDEAKKLCPYVTTGASLKLEIKAASEAEKEKKAEEFKNNNEYVSASYTDISTFEINLNLVTSKDGSEEKTKVAQTSSSMLITIPIPESLQKYGNSIAILRKHNGVIEEVGSVVSADGKTVSFYTDKFSDYAIAVKKDNPGTVEEGGKDNPSTDPITPSDPGTSVTTPSAPSGPDTSAAVKTVSDTTAAVKGVIDASTLAESSKKLAGSLIDAIKAEADKKMAAASSQSDANAIAEQAKKDMEAVQARAEKAGKIADVPAAGDLPTAVQYGMIKGYINGTSDTAFQPAGSVTRAQFAAFLYRLAGSPETSDTGAFSDTASVSGGADFAKAIAWAAEQGIAQGFGDGTFRPYETVTREQAVAFLHRYMKGLTNTGSSKFTDVKDGSWYAADINWGVANGIINGYADNSFGVGDNTTRGQAVQFIYRALASGSAVSG